MRISERFYFGTNKFIKFLISFFLQLALYLTFIGLFEYILVVMDLSSKTPRKIIYIEAFALYLIGRVANSAVDIIRSKKGKDSNDDDNDDQNNEDFF